MNILNRFGVVPALILLAILGIGGFLFFGGSPTEKQAVVAMPKKGESSLVGKWVDTTGSLEFLQDGTLIGSPAGSPVFSGSYRLIDANRVELKTSFVSTVIEIEFKDSDTLLVKPAIFSSHQGGDTTFKREK
jgi:hypothetical protein